MKYRRLFGTILIVVYLLADYFGAALLALSFGDGGADTPAVAFGPVGLVGIMVGIAAFLVGNAAKYWLRDWWEWVNGR